ncbi:MAG: hypothetical protein DRI57_09900 [Deltaproteobacteria bacterium]|nr:MAG: hypothetical protein DRI57_09900 [Deltaproteobacteria bacterium]
MGFLQGEIREIKSVTDEEVRIVYDRLYKDYYDGVTYDGYFKDHFKEKDYVILLSADGVIQGFSLQQIIYTKIDNDNKEIVILWAGDILVHPDFWGKNEYRVKLAELCLMLYNENPDKLVYRLATPKGYKTYGVVQNLFHKFYPSPDYNYYPEFESKIIDKVLSSKYPPEIYNKESKTLIVKDNDHRLAKGFAQVTPDKLKDPFIRCFYENNPDYARGNEIPVISRITPDNLKVQEINKA